MRIAIDPGAVSSIFFRLLVVVSTSSALPCRFSQEWRGRYFQSGLGEIIIRENVITTKGTCIEQSRDYYLFDNREQNCFYCLLLLHQHKNLIQYKESFCTTPASLKLVCTQIRVETPLYTLVREPALPIRCPFQDAYHFKYNDLSHGFCKDDASYAEPCASQSKYRLKFQHCESTALYNGKELDFECLASWKDGSETYLYSRLNGTDSEAKDDRYRCFKYEQYGHEVSLAMSADATCRGLRTAKDGPFLLEFSKDNSGWPPPSCNFPDWLKGVTWRDLIGRHRYTIDEHGERLFVSLRNAPKDQVSSQFRCRHVTSTVRHQSNDVDEYIIHTFATNNCESSYQCLKVKKLASHVVELQLGKPGQRDGHTFCQTETYQNAQILTADGSASTATACPRPGMYHTAPEEGCIYRLSVGCRADTSVEIDHSCSQGRPGLLLECLTTWIDGQKSYVIVKQKQSDILNCYSFREQSGAVVFGVDQSCNRNVSLIGGQPNHPYSFIRHETCRRETRATTVTKPSDQHKRTTTRATPDDEDDDDDDWPFPDDDYRRKEISVRHEYPVDYDADDDDDDDYDDDGNGGDFFDKETEGHSGAGVSKTDRFERNRESSLGRAKGVHNSDGTFQNERVTSHVHRQVVTTNRVTTGDDVHRRNPPVNPGHGALSTNSGPLSDRKTENKGRKHAGSMKPHSTDTKSRSKSSVHRPPPPSILAIVTTLCVAAVRSALW